MCKKNIYILCCSLIFCFCTPAFLVPTNNDLSRAKTRWADTNMQSLMSGRHLYIEKCGKCHYLYHPSKFPEEKWKKEAYAMQKEAKIDSVQVELILKFIFVMKDTVKIQNLSNP